uniref:Uncharacterized protein n=1 Tax=Oryza brachyantha TaxID=4533 RepID=J3M4K6_ORYBR
MATTAAASASSVAMQETKAMPSNSIVHWECVTGEVLVIMLLVIFRACPVVQSHSVLVGRSSSGFTLLRARWEPPLAVRHAPYLQLAALASAAPRVALPQPQAWDPQPPPPPPALKWLPRLALPLSTSLLLATQLARLHRNHRFTVMFVFLIVGLR